MQQSPTSKNQHKIKMHMGFMSMVLLKQIKLLLLETIQLLKLQRQLLLLEAQPISMPMKEQAL